MNVDFEQLLRQLEGANFSKAHGLLKQEVLDHVEFLEGELLGEFLRLLMPWMVRTLETVPIQFEAGTEQDLRNIILEIFYKIPKNSQVVSLADGLMKLVLSILVQDNEKNASRCLSIIFSLHKSYRKNLDNYIPGFLQFFKTLYRNFSNSVSTGFQSHSQSQLRKGLFSFKLITECPLLVMLLFQVYPAFFKGRPEELREIVNLMVGTLRVSAPSNDPLFKEAFAEFIAAQVKSLAFLTFLLRGEGKNLLEPFQDDICKSVLNLLLKCPLDMTESRKEILTACRNLINSNFHRSFYQKLDFFLDNKVFYEFIATDKKELRPLAHTMLSELAFNFRDSLSLSQISRVISIFSQSVCDDTLPVNTQIASVRMILNVVDSIYKTKESLQGATEQLGLILACFVCRVQRLAETSPFAETAMDVDQDDGEGEHVDKQPKLFRSLLHDIIFGLKTVVWCRVDLSKQIQPVKPFVYSEEFKLISQFLFSGLTCFRAYEEEPPLEKFASVFTQLDVQSFRSLFSSQMRFLFKEMVESDLDLVVIPHHFLTNSNVSSVFADISLGFIASNISLLYEGTIKERSVINQMFIRIVRTLMLYPSNESVLRPGLQELVQNILRECFSHSDCEDLLQLLWTLFKGIQGKFEHLYQEIFAILPDILSDLQMITQSATGKTRELSIELSLTVPAKLSSLLPFMEMLMEALGLALNSNNPTLIKMGLRTFEYWVDNLSLEFLNPFLQAHLDQIVPAFNKALRTEHPSRVDRTCLRLLGKVGGPARAWFEDTFTFTCRNPLPAIEFPVESADFTLEGNWVVNSTSKILDDSSPSVQDLLACFHLLSSSLQFLIPAEPEPISEPDVSFENLTIRQRPLREAQQDLFYQLLDSLLLCCIKLAEHGSEHECKEYLLQTVDTFAVFYCNLCEKSAEEQSQALDESVFYVSLVKCLSSIPPAKTLLAAELLGKLLESFEFSQVSISFLDALSDEICHLCYQESIPCRFGGCLGIDKLMECLPEEWVRSRHSQLQRALMLCVSDLPGDLSRRTNSLASTALSDLLGLCIQQDSSIQDQEEAIQRFVNLLAPALVSPQDSLRLQAQRLLQSLSHETQRPCSTLLGRFKDKLVQPLLRKASQGSLSGIPISVRIGYTSALAQCVSMKPPLVSGTDPGLIDLLQLLLAELGEKKLDVPSRKNHELYRLFLHNLEFLSAISATEWFRNAIPDISSTAQNDSKTVESLKSQTVKVLFKSLALPCPGIVKLAKEALQALPELPKELLKECLRPVLTSLAEPHTLSLEALATLKLLLELLHKYFNAQLADKLLQHLDAFVESIGDVRIPIALYELFPLLPSASPKVLVHIVHNLLQMERALGNTAHFAGTLEGHISPFRKSLIAFCEVHADQSLDRFIETSSLSQTPLASLLLDILSKSSLLRQRMVSRLPQLAQCLHYNSPFDLQANTVRIIQLIGNPPDQVVEALIHLLEHCYQKQLQKPTLAGLSLLRAVFCTLSPLELPARTLWIMAGCTALSPFMYFSANMMRTASIPSEQLLNIALAHPADPRSSLIMELMCDNNVELSPEISQLLVPTLEPSNPLLNSSLSLLLKLVQATHSVPEQVVLSLEQLFETHPHTPALILAHLNRFPTHLFPTLLSSLPSDYDSHALEAIEIVFSDIPKLVPELSHRLSVDAHSMSKLYHTLALIVKNSETLQEDKLVLAPMFVASLDALAMISHRPSKYKTLALDLVQVLLDWKVPVHPFLQKTQAFLLQFILRCKHEQLLQRSLALLGEMGLDLDPSWVSKLVQSLSHTETDPSLISLSLRLVSMSPKHQWDHLFPLFKSLMPKLLVTTHDTVLSAVCTMLSSVPTEILWTAEGWFKELWDTLPTFSNLLKLVQTLEPPNCPNSLFQLQTESLAKCIHVIRPGATHQQICLQALVKALESGEDHDQDLVISGVLAWNMDPQDILNVLVLPPCSLSVALVLALDVPLTPRSLPFLLQAAVQGHSKALSLLKHHSLTPIQHLALLFTSDSWQFLQQDWIPHTLVLAISSLYGLDPNTHPLLILQYDAELAHSLWKRLFVVLYDQLDPKDQQECLTLLLANIETCSSTFHSSALIQTVIETICELDSEHVAQNTLAKVSLDHGGYCAVLNSLPSSSSVLPQLYSDLHEHDLLSGLSPQLPSSAKTFLRYQQFGLWHRARDALAFALREEGPEQLYQQEWRRCMLQLGQWDVLAALAEETGDDVLLTESLARLGKWKEIVSIDRNGENEGTGNTLTMFASIGHELNLLQTTLMTETDTKLSQDDENSFQQCFDQLCDKTLESWKRLANPPSDLMTAHMSMFQRLVETKESQVILGKVRSLDGRPETLVLQRPIDTWRARLPHQAEDLYTWTALLSWRICFFKTLASTLHLPDITSKYPRFHDIPWTHVRLATAARKLSVPSVALTALSELSSAQTLESSDAFSHLVELVKLTLHTQDQHQLALNLLQQTNLDYFSDQQKAELFRLKAESLEKLTMLNDSHHSFMAATSAWDVDGKAWTTWGHFCDKIFSKNKETLWAEYAIACYFRGIAHGYEKAKLMLARVLWLVSYSYKDGPILNTFARYAPTAPLWVWMLWIPQMISSLHRPEGDALSIILQHIAVEHPQALYYRLRAHMLGLRDVKPSAPSNAPAAPSPDDSKTYVLTSHGLSSSSSDVEQLDNNPSNPEHSEENVNKVIQTLQRAHPSLVAEIEKVLEQISRRLKPHPEEELLGAINTLFLRCFRQPVSSPDDVPPSLLSAINSVYSKFFTNNQQLHPSLAQHKQAFESELLPSSKDFARHLTELMRRLKKWKAALLFSVGQYRLKLESLSTTLSHFKTQELEIPGQYNESNQPLCQVLLEGFHPDILVKRTHYFSPRQLSMLGSDGRVYSFLVQYSISHLMRTEERNLQIQTVLNRLYRGDHNARRKACKFDLRSCTPLTHRLSLQETRDSDTSLEQVYEESCALSASDPDFPLTLYRNHIGSVFSWERNRQARKEVFKHITETILPCDILYRSVQRRLSCPEEFWAFRKTFASQTALFSFLCYIMNVGERLPYRLNLDMSRASLFNSEFFPCYNGQQLVESKESVPFRLSPNMTRLMGPHLLHGVFGSTFLAQPACLVKSMDVLKNLLYLFFRDDIVSYAQAMAPNDSRTKDLEASGQLREKVSLNTVAVLKRIEWFMVPSEEREVIGHKVDRLISEASDATNLSMMNPVWYPWL